MSTTKPKRFAHPVQLNHTDLQLVTSDIRQFHMIAGRPKDESSIGNQPVTCDFEIVTHEKNPNQFIIMVLLGMENSENKPEALALSMSTVTEFEYRPQGTPRMLPDDDGERWSLYYSGLNTAIGIIRGYLINLLAPTLYHSYRLPLVDVESLLNKKYVRATFPDVPSSGESVNPPTSSESK